MKRAKIRLGDSKETIQNSSTDPKDRKAGECKIHKMTPEEKNKYGPVAMITCSRCGQQKPARSFIRRDLQDPENKRFISGTNPLGHICADCLGGKKRGAK